MFSKYITAKYDWNPWKRAQAAAASLPKAKKNFHQLIVAVDDDETTMTMAHDEWVQQIQVLQISLPTLNC